MTYYKAASAIWRGRQNSESRYESDQFKPRSTRVYSSGSCWYLILSKGNHHHSIMPRQRVQHSANLISTRPFSTLYTVTMKGCLLTFSIVILVYGVGANFPCKSEQIHWNDTVGKRYKCLDCPDCPAGSQPSVACGSSVKYGTPVDCISCTLGKTYSDKYDKSQCKACTICSKGKAVKNNCTLSANTKCEKKCAHGFYPVPFIFSCLPCTQCCDDGKDELATECTNYEKKCKVRSTPCTNVRTTSSGTTRRAYNTSSTLPITQTVPDQFQTTMQTYEDEKRVSDELSLPITPTWSLDNEALRGEEEESVKQDGTSIAVIMFVVVLALCLVLVVLVIIKKVIRVRDMLRSSREPNPNNESNNIAQGKAPPQSNQSSSSQSSAGSRASTSPILNRSCGESLQLNGSPQPDGSVPPQPCGSAPPQPNPSKSPHLNGFASAQSNRSAREEDKSNTENVTLEQLEENNLPVFDWMCKELDIRGPGTRWGFERLASHYTRISLTDRNSLKNEFQNERGSPSQALMYKIKTQYPNLSVRQLVGTLQRIERNDIALALMPYIVRKVDNSSTLGH